MPGLDPIRLARVAASRVGRLKNGVEERRYYRFRGGRWYGGIATGDVVGCNLRCKFCWSWRYSFYYDKGYFKDPYTVHRILSSIALKRRYRYVRLSGGEPTLTPRHLLALLELLSETRLIFILETNGILIGYDKRLAESLAGFRRIAVRVSFKGTSPLEFERLTGADRRFYEYQFKAIENLIDAGLRPGEQVYPAVMLSFSREEDVGRFIDRLREIDPVLPDNIDPEYVILYPHVKWLLEKNGLKPRRAYSPSGVPEFMV